MNRDKRRTGDSKGSLTVECLLFLIPVMCAFFSLVNVSRFVQAEVLIHHAITQTAKQISVYSYALTKAGISEKMIETNKKSDKFKADVGTITGSVSKFFKAIEGVADGGDIEESVNEVVDAADLAGDKIKEYMENPKEIVAGVLSMLKEDVRSKILNLVIGGISRGAIKQSLSCLTDNPDAYLKELGIVDGINGLDFDNSQWIGNVDGKANIEIVVTYKMKNLMFPQFDFGTHDYRLCASTLIW